MPHFALIDAARDPSIANLVRQEKAWQCMFGGNLDPAVEAVAPYIVRLDPGSNFTNILQTHGWTNAWGITCHAAAKMVDVRRKLRQNLEVVMPLGETGLFRFYDPRVFVPFISASAPHELEPWFDPIDAYWAPHPKTGATMVFTIENGHISAKAA